MPKLVKLVLLVIYTQETIKKTRDSDTNLQFLLTKEVLSVLKQYGKRNKCRPLWILSLCCRLFSSKPIPFFLINFSSTLIILRFLLMYLFKVQLLSPESFSADSLEGSLPATMFCEMMAATQTF